MSKKIALIRGPFLRPNGVYAWDRLDQMDNPYSITAFCSKPKKFPTETLSMEVKSLPWIDGYLSFFGYDNIISKALTYFRFPSNMLWGIKKISEDFDVIHVSENYHIFSIQSAFWCNINNCDLIVAADENIPYPNFQRRWINWKLKKYVNKTAIAFSTVTHRGKQALIHEGVEAGKIGIVPNSVDTELFKLFDVEPDEISVLDNSKETFNILFVHGLNKQKGVRYLIEAVEKLHEELPNLQLILIGTNDLPPNYYHDHIENSGFVTHINRIPNNKMPYFYNISDVSVLPSITVKNNEEQFGMAVIEAMACGTPTVVTNVGGLPYVVSDGTSSIVEERSSQELARAIRRLYLNSDLREEMSENSINFVQKEYSKQAAAEKLEAFYYNYLM